MTATEYHKINGIIEQIKKVEAMIKKAEDRKPDPASELIAWQFERMKKDFIKQLLAELMTSDVKVADLEKFFKNAAPYLKKFDPEDELDEALRTNLSEVGKSLAA